MTSPRVSLSYPGTSTQDSGPGRWCQAGWQNLLLCDSSLPASVPPAGAGAAFSSQAFLGGPGMTDMPLGFLWRTLVMKTEEAGEGWGLACRWSQREPCWVGAGPLFPQEVTGLHRPLFFTCPQMLKGCVGSCQDPGGKPPGPFVAACFPVCLEAGLFTVNSGPFKQQHLLLHRTLAVPVEGTSGRPRSLSPVPGPPWRGLLSCSPRTGAFTH